MWEGKCQFLESQKETYKKDLHETQKKFELTLDQMSKKGSQDKDKIENNQQTMMKIIEKRYKDQISQFQDISNCQQMEYQQKIKRLEGELKSLNEKLQMETRGKLNEYGSLEKKVVDLIETEKRNQSEIDELKAERDRRVSDYQRLLEKEKDAYRLKLSEYE